MFGRGVALGLAIAAALILVGVGWLTGNMELTFRDFGSSEHLPAITRFALGPWHIVAPVAALAAVIYLSIRRPRTFELYVVVVVLALGAAVFTWSAALAPLTMIGDGLKD